MRNIVRMGTGLLGAFLLLGGCGGSDEPPPAAVAPTPSAQAPATPTPAPLTVAGQVALGSEPGPQRVVSVELHDADLRMRVLPLVESMMQLSAAIREQQAALRDLRDQVALAAGHIAEKELIQTEIAALEKEAQPGIDLMKATDEAVAFYTKVKAEFIRLGPNRMPVTDPITGTQIVLNAHGGQKENSIALIEAQIKRHDGAIADVRKAVALLQEDAARLQKRVDQLTVELSDLNSEERRNRFVELFMGLRQKTRQLAEAESLVLRARDNSKALAVALSSEDGHFRMETGSVDGIVLVVHKAELPARDGQSVMCQILWMLPVDGATSPMVSATLSDANATLLAPVESLEAWARYENETEGAMRPRVREYISKYPIEEGEVADWIGKMLR